MTPIIVQQAGRTRCLRLNRPDRRNALSPELIEMLDEEINKAEADDDTAAIVIAGEGASFCAGADLRYLADMTETGEDPIGFLTSISRCLSHIEQSVKPTVAAVHGHVVAGGLELALTCDVVIARAGTVIGDGHVRNGLLPAGGASVRLARKVGEPLARWLILTGEMLPAERFVAGGFINAVVPGDSFSATVMTAADSLGRVPVDASTRVRRMLEHQRHAPPDTALAHELDVFAEHWREFDVATGLAAFFQRTEDR